MAMIVKPFTFVSGNLIRASEMNANLDAIIDEFNGNITSVNVANGAIIEDKLAAGAVVEDKLAEGAVTNSKVATEIDAIKIADGSVSNEEFQRLDGVTSAIQTQLNNRLLLSGGVMSGSQTFGVEDVTTSGLQIHFHRVVSGVSRRMSLGVGEDGEASIVNSQGGVSRTLRFGALGLRYNPGTGFQNVMVGGNVTRVFHGAVNLNGTQNTPFPGGWSVVRNGVGSGSYTLTHNLSTNNYTPNIVAEEGVNISLTRSTNLIFINFTNPNGSPTDSDFYFQVFVT